MFLVCVELPFCYVRCTSEKMSRIDHDRHFRDLYLNDLTFQCEQLKVARAWYVH